MRVIIGKAAVPAITFLQLRADAGHVLAARLRLFDGDGPEDPLVAGERREGFPLGAGFGAGEKRGAQIGRDSVDDAGGELGGYGDNVRQVSSIVAKRFAPSPHYSN